MKRMLLLVDPQCDFITGSLPVPGADLAMNALAARLEADRDRYAIKIVTCDLHPYDHCSFKKHGGQWPPHCVHHTTGAAIWPALVAPLHEGAGPVHILGKGADPAVEEYSIFGNQAHAQTIKNLVRKHSIDAIDICGIAGDICVLNTLADGVRLFGSELFTVLRDFSPSLDGGKALDTFISKELPCAR